MFEFAKWPRVNIFQFYLKDDGLWLKCGEPRLIKDIHKWRKFFFLDESLEPTETQFVWKTLIKTAHSLHMLHDSKGIEMHTPNHKLLVWWTKIVIHCWIVILCKVYVVVCRVLSSFLVVNKKITARVPFQFFLILLPFLVPWPRKGLFYQNVLAESSEILQGISLVLKLQLSCMVLDSTQN